MQSGINSPDNNTPNANLQITRRSKFFYVHGHGDGIVGVDDLLMVIAAWGQGP
jgi:hypothetical protein